MTRPSESTTEARFDRLNAYLDGELPTDERTRVEQELAADRTLQSDFKQLQRAWDLLDVLPRADVDAGFTRSTVEMISLNAADELTAVEQTLPRRRWIDGLLIASGAAVAAVAGYLAIAALQPRPDEALLQDLPVVERIDLYGRAEHGTTADFLRTVRDKKLLPPPSIGDVR